MLCSKPSRSINLRSNDCGTEMVGRITSQTNAGRSYPASRSPLTATVSWFNARRCLRSSMSMLLMPIRQVLMTGLLASLEANKDISVSAMGAAHPTISTPDAIRTARSCPLAAKPKKTLFGRPVREVFFFDRPVIGRQPLLKFGAVFDPCHGEIKSMVGCTGMEGLPTDGVHQSYRCVFNTQGAQRHQQPVKLFGVHGWKVA